MTRRNSRIYARGRGPLPRFWADFRDYRDAGGGQEALIPPSRTQATTDPDEAARLAAERLRQLEAARRDRSLYGLSRATTLGSYSAEHLRKKAEAGKVTTKWLEAAEIFLQRAVDYLGTNRALHSVTVADMQAWLAHLRTRERASNGTLRHHLNAVSNLYRRAQSEGVVPPGFNPVAGMLEKPTGARGESRWLEVHDAALFLEAARRLPAVLGGRSMAYGYPLVAVFLLTGGREREVLGLEVSDVSFDRQTVTFRPNDWRRLKTLTSARVTPLWPQLEEVLRPWVFGTDRPPARLLFPSYLTGAEQMVGDARKLLDTIGKRAGWNAGEIRSRMFRHTYTAARLQTTDQGAPVSPYTVSRELGHGSRAMVEQVYSHLGIVRHRSEMVEYRVNQHRERLGERLERVEAGVILRADSGAA